MRAFLFIFVSNKTSMDLLNNQVLIEPIKIEKAKGIYIPDSATQAQMYSNVSGIVKRVPEKPVYNRENPESLHVKLPFEIQEGDQVWFHFTCEPEARQKGKYIGDDFLVNYRDIYVAKRRGHIIPLNGFVLAEPLKPLEELFPAMRAAGFVGLDKALDADDYKNRCRVTHLGQLIPEYKWGIDDEVIQPDDPSIQIGDELLLTPFVGNELEKLEHTLDENKSFYRFQRRDIVGKIINGTLQSVSDRLLIKADPVVEKIGNIFIPEIAEESVVGRDGRWGTVINTGYLVKEKATRIYFNQWRAMKVMFNKEEYFSVRQRHILGVD